MMLTHEERQYYGQQLRYVVRERARIRAEMERHHISSGAMYSLTGELVRVNCFRSELLRELREMRVKKKQ